MHLSPPQNADASSKLMNRLGVDLAAQGHTLRDAPPGSLIQSLANCGIVSMWLQREPCLDNWQDRTEQIESLMVSDVEYEVLYSGHTVLLLTSLILCFT